MKEQRVRFMSNASTLASLSEPGSCYDELLKYLVHIVRKGAKQVAHVFRFLARRAGLNIAASPPAQEPQRTQRRRRKSRHGSMLVHHMAHHHHHHQHYHLGNGSVRGAGRGLDDVEAASNNNNGGSLIATSGHITLAPPPSIATTSDTDLAALPSPGDCTLSPTSFNPFSLAPAPVSKAMKRNSVPFAAPGPKNYPTLQARALAESRRGSMAVSTLSNLHLKLNIPPMSLERRHSCMVDTHNPAGNVSQYILQLTVISSED